MLLHELVDKFNFSESVCTIKIYNKNDYNITSTMQNPNNSLIYMSAKVVNFSIIDNSLVIKVSL